MAKSRLCPFARKSGVTMRSLTCRLGCKLCLDEFHEAPHRLKNLGRDFIVCNDDAESVFQRSDQSYHGPRIQFRDGPKKLCPPVEMLSPVSQAEHLPQYDFDFIRNVQIGLLSCPLLTRYLR